MTDPQQIIAGLVQRGVPPAAAIGMAGNIAIESRFDPGINEIAPLVPGSRGGFGLIQWTGPRRRQLEAFAGDRVADLDTQLDFLVHELNTTERSARDAIYGAQDPETAARLVSEKFLRPGIPHLDRRIEETRRLAGMDPSAPYSAPPQGQAAGQPQADPDSAYQAYLEGRMSPEQQQAYMADVAAGRMPVPEAARQPIQGRQQQPQQQQRQPMGIDPNAAMNVYQAYANRSLGPSPQNQQGAFPMYPGFSA